MPGSVVRGLAIVSPFNHAQRILIWTALMTRKEWKSRLRVGVKLHLLFLTAAASFRRMPCGKTLPSRR